MTTWQPGDPVDPHGGAPELYCACGARAAGPTLNHGMPCPECGQPMTFDPSACLDRWRQLRDDAVNALTRAQTVTAVRTTALTLRQLAGWCIDGQLETTEQELRALADQVDHIEPGWCCPMCEEATCDGGCPLEHVRDHLADLTYDGHLAEQAFADAAGIDLNAVEPDHVTASRSVPGRWTLTCYGEPADEYVTTLDEAKRTANVHIRHHCPHGPMPWAALIIWHQTTLPELGGRYAAAAGGSWLNHHLIPQGDPR